MYFPGNSKKINDLAAGRPGGGGARARYPAPRAGRGARAGGRLRAAHRRAGSVRERLAALRRIEAALAGLVDDCCAAAKHAAPSGTVSCPLIASIQHAD